MHAKTDYFTFDHVCGLQDGSFFLLLTENLQHIFIILAGLEQTLVIEKNITICETIFSKIEGKKLPYFYLKY